MLKLFACIGIDLSTLPSGILDDFDHGFHYYILLQICLKKHGPHVFVKLFVFATTPHGTNKEVNPLMMVKPTVKNLQKLASPRMKPMTKSLNP